MKEPGNGWLRLDGVVAKFTDSRSSPHEVSNRYPFDDVTASDVPPTAVANGSEAGKSGSGCGVPATVLSPLSPLEKYYFGGASQPHLAAKAQHLSRRRVRARSLLASRHRW
jgi:hypothetical protein